MSIRFEKGRWVVDVYLDGRRGKRPRIAMPKGATEQEALAFEKTLKRKTIKATSSGLTVRDVYNLYMEWYELRRSPRTIEDVKNTFEHFLLPTMENELAENVSTLHVLKYQKLRKAGEVTNRTINKELAYFSGMLRWAEKPENGYITPRAWKIENLPHSRPIPQTLTPREVSRIIAAAEPFYKPLFLLLYTVGLRLSEALNLRYSDIDIESDTLIVRQKGSSFKRLPVPPMLLAHFKEKPFNEPHSANNEGY